MRTRLTLWRLLLLTLKGSWSPGRSLDDDTPDDGWVGEEQWLAGFPVAWRDYPDWCGLRNR